MKILIISDVYPPYYLGGHEVQIKIIADHLSRKGHEVTVLTGDYGTAGKTKEANVYRILRNVFLDEGSTGIRKRFHEMRDGFRSFRNLHTTLRFLKEKKFDIIYAGQTAKLSAYPIIACQKQKIPIVHHLGNSYFVYLSGVACFQQKHFIKCQYRQLINGFFSLKTIDFSNSIFASRNLKKKFLRYGFSVEKNLVFPLASVPLNAVAGSSRSMAPATSGTCLSLLYAGRLVKDKGAHVAIEAVSLLVKQMKDRRLQFDIYGEGDSAYRKELQKMILHYQLQDIVRLRGKLSRDELLDVYSKYDLLLFPSITDEVFPVAPLEAFAQGVPVVATDSGGTSEVVENGKTGFIVPPGDALAMAAAIKQILQDTHLYSVMSCNAIEYIRNNFIEEVVADKVEKILTEVLSSKIN